MLTNIVEFSNIFIIASTLIIQQQFISPFNSTLTTKHRKIFIWSRRYRYVANHTLRFQNTTKVHTNDTEIYTVLPTVEIIGAILIKASFDNYNYFIWWLLLKTLERHDGKDNVKRLAKFKTFTWMSILFLARSLVIIQIRWL